MWIEIALGGGNKIGKFHICATQKRILSLVL